MFSFNLVPELTELIQGVELVPECSTLRNRMYSPAWSDDDDSIDVWFSRTYFEIKYYLSL